VSAAIARSTSGWMPALQGFRFEWPLATPTIGFSKSVSPNPTARSIARLGERSAPSTTRRENLRESLSAMTGHRVASRPRLTSRAAGPDDACMRRSGISGFFFRTAQGYGPTG
jgi:hypothetical protein